MSIFEGPFTLEQHEANRCGDGCHYCAAEKKLVGLDRKAPHDSAHVLLQRGLQRLTEREALGDALADCLFTDTRLAQVRSRCSCHDLRTLAQALAEKIQAAHGLLGAPEARDHVQVTAGSKVDHSEGQGDSRGESETSAAVGVAGQGSGEA